MRREFCYHMYLVKLEATPRAIERNIETQHHITFYLNGQDMSVTTFHTRPTRRGLIFVNNDCLTRIDSFLNSGFEYSVVLCVHRIDFLFVLCLLIAQNTKRQPNYRIFFDLLIKFVEKIIHTNPQSTLYIISIQSQKHQLIQLVKSIFYLEQEAPALLPS